MPTPDAEALLSTSERAKLRPEKRTGNAAREVFDMTQGNAHVRRRIATATLAGCFLFGGPVAAQDWF
jgi:hypothetical protein